MARLVAPCPGAPSSAHLDGLRVALQAMLASPFFLYRFEIGQAEGDRFRLTAHEVATALSYGLLGTTPDDALLDAADAGQLQTSEDIEAQVRRLLEDPRARGVMGTFATQWLGVENIPMVPASCEEPSLDTTGVVPGSYEPTTFPAVLRAQIDLTVLAMACGLSRVGVIQCAHHTSDILITQFPGTEMYDPGFNITSHGASHYGASHSGQSYDAHFQQGKYWAEQFAYLLQSLRDRPDPLGGGSMLDTSVVLLCTEVSDGNTHEHHDMPLALAGRACGAIDTGRLLNFSGDRHAGLLAAIAHAMGEPVGGFGDTWSGPLPGVLA